MAFFTKEFSTTAGGGSFFVSVEANCSWVITEQSELITVQPSSGSGDSSVLINVSANFSYEDLFHSVTIASEDGTSKDAITISQERVYVVQAESTDMISCEGGEFSVSVKSNDDISEVKTPDWVSFTESRSLTEYTYKFYAEPNKTGKVRQETIELIGDKSYANFKVRQDSYAPTSVTIEDFPAYLIETSFWRYISVEPEYADLSKLEVSFPETGAAKIGDYGGYLISVYMPEYGKYPISIYAGNDTLFRAEPEHLPTNPFASTNPAEAYLGQSEGIAQWTFQSYLYTLESSDVSVIRVVDNRRFEAVGIGTSVISAGIPGTRIHSKRTISVERFAVRVNVGQIKQLEDGSYDVTFSAMIKGPRGFEISDFTVKDKSGAVVFKNEGDTKPAGSDGYTINTPKTNVDFDRKEYSSINSFLSGYKFTATVDIGGNKFQREVYINGYTVSEF